MTLIELAERVDIKLANLSILKTGTAKAIPFSMLGAICRELDCQPGKLLAYENDCRLISDAQYFLSIALRDHDLD